MNTPDTLRPYILQRNAPVSPLLTREQALRAWDWLRDLALDPRHPDNGIAAIAAVEWTEAVLAWRRGQRTLHYIAYRAALQPNSEAFCAEIDKLLGEVRSVDDAASDETNARRYYALRTIVMQRMEGRFGRPQATEKEVAAAIDAEVDAYIARR